VRIVAAARDRRAEVPIAVDDERAGLDAGAIARRQVLGEPVDRGLLPQLIAQSAFQWKPTFSVEALRFWAT
jgi:hypothetical protein